AAQMHWEILEAHIYQDTAVSGFGVEHRPAYQQLVAAALAPLPPFSVILVDDLSRLSRDLVETLSIYRRLKGNHVELVAVSDGIQTSNQMAKLQITIKGLVNELYLDDLRDKTHRGMTGRALKGRSTGGRLFGYRTSPTPDGAEWLVFEPEAEIVRRIFHMYADTCSMKTIAATLNAEGVPFPAKVTRRGPMRRGGPCPPSTPSCSTTSTRAAGSGIRRCSSRTPRPASARPWPDPRTTGWSTTGPIWPSSTARCGRRSRSG